MGKIGLRAKSHSPIYLLFIYLPPVHPLHKAGRAKERKQRMILLEFNQIFTNPRSCFPEQNIFFGIISPPNLCNMFSNGRIRTTNVKRVYFTLSLKLI